MGDSRYAEPLTRFLAATDRAAALRGMADDSVVAALAAASLGERDPYVSNVLASEAMNRMRRATAIARCQAEATLAVDASGACTYANPASLRALATHRDGLVGADLHAKLHPEGTCAPQAPCNLAQALQASFGEEVTRGETVLVRQDGSRFPASFSVAPIMRDDVRQGAVLTFEDATARHERERERRLLTFLVDSTTDAVWSTDLEGRITSWNAAAEATYGYATDEMLGAPLAKLVPEHRRGEDLLILQRARQREPMRSFETQQRARNGAVLTLWLTTSPIVDGEGRLVGVSGIARPVPTPNPHRERVMATDGIHDAEPTYPVPTDEDERLEVLSRYRILDTPSEPEWEDLVHLAAQICGTPIALVSLVDECRQWFKARVGLGPQQTPRSQSFCSHAILRPEDVMVVPDARSDERFATNPLVLGPPHIRFYAGVPLVTSSGQALGTLCVIDERPRTLEPEQLEGLKRVARQATRLLELRRALADAAGTE